MITLYYYFMAKDTLTDSQSETLLRALTHTAFEGADQVFTRTPDWHCFAGTAFDQGTITVSPDMLAQLGANISKVRERCSPFLDALVIYHEDQGNFEVPSYPDVQHTVIPVITGPRNIMHMVRLKMLKHLTGGLNDAIHYAFQI